MLRGPPGSRPIVRSSVEIMKLANTPLAEGTTPSGRMSTQSVAALRRTIPSW